MLENDWYLEEAHKSVALQGDSDVPTNPEDEVDFHYITFVKSHRSGHLYEMDGDRKGPIDKGPLGQDEDILSENALRIVREYLEREDGGNLGFSLMVLAPS